MAVLYIVLTLLGLLLLLILWGLLEPYTIDVQEQRGEIPDLPDSWVGARVAVIGDIQVGMWLTNISTVRRIVRKIVREKPDLVLLTGDFIYDKRSAITEAVSLVRPLTEAALPVYAVLGNHDYAMPTKKDAGDQGLVDALEEALEEVGIPVLHNEAVKLKSPAGEALYLVAVGAHVPEDDHPEKALAEVPEDAPRIALMHHPASFDKFPAYSAPLAVAGHTHGGQISLPGSPYWTYLTYFYGDDIYVAGWVDDPAVRGYGADGNHLYINRGIGFSVVPLRIRCPPELTFFTLHRPA